MKVIKVVVVMAISLLSLNVSIRAQETVKAKFKKIELVTYDLNSPRTRQNGKVELLNYAVINGNGFIQIRNESNAGTKHYTSELTSSMIDSLNQIFNGETELNTFMVQHKQEEGQHFAGYYKYITYSSSNNKSDTLCFIEPSMSKGFNDVVGKIKNVIYRQPKKEIEASNAESQALLSAIAFEHKKSAYLPSIEMPPPPAN